jgi:hypothetical protein
MMWFWIIVMVVAVVAAFWLFARRRAGRAG